MRDHGATLIPLKHQELSSATATHHIQAIHGQAGHQSISVLSAANHGQDRPGAGEAGKIGSMER